METEKVYLNFYGVSVSVTGDLSLAEKLKNDFKYFFNEKSASVNADIELTVRLKEPDFSLIPSATASMYKNNCICYDKDGIRYSVYSGKALAVYDIKKERVTIESLSYDLLYEISYLYIHSRAGEKLDMRGIHRIHACAFSYRDNIYVCILPQGAGKSTFLTGLLKNEEIKIISDDTPLINKKGTVLPFPIRIGLCSNSDFSFIPAEYISSFKRQNFEEKKLVSYSFFKDRTEERKLPVTILCGQRISGKQTKIVPANIFYVFKELFKCAVIGYGLPQVIEYFITGGFKDILKKSRIVLLRTAACIRFILSAKKTYRFYIGTDKEFNTEYFLKFFDKF